MIFENKFYLMRIVGIMRVVDWGLRADRVGRVDGVGVGNLFALWSLQIFVNFEMLSQRRWMSVCLSAPFNLKNHY